MPEKVYLISLLTTSLSTSKEIGSPGWLIGLPRLDTVMALPSWQLWACWQHTYSLCHTYWPVQAYRSSQIILLWTWKAEHPCHLAPTLLRAQKGSWPSYQGSTQAGRGPAEIFPNFGKPSFSIPFPCMKLLCSFLQVLSRCDFHVITPASECIPVSFQMLTLTGDS